MVVLEVTVRLGEGEVADGGGDGGDIRRRPGDPKYCYCCGLEARVEQLAGRSASDLAPNQSQTDHGVSLQSACKSWLLTALQPSPDQLRAEAGSGRSHASYVYIHT